MNIGDAATATGLPAKTIRYYEEIGLIAPDRTENGYRNFGPTHIHNLRFIARARSLGFGVEECRTLLELWQDRGRASADVKALAQGHLDAIDAKMAELKTMRATLSDLIHACTGDHRPDCPILDRLGEDASG